MNRRTFIHTTSWGGVIGMAAPNLFAAGQKAGGPIMVVIQLAGGNDGLNTVVPIDNDYYYKARPKLGIAPPNTLKINDATGLHPSLVGAKALYDEGRLAIIEGVGYPNPNRSHFRSTEIWHTGSDANVVEKYGWLGRYFDAYRGADPASVGLCVGKENPQAFAAAMPKGVTFYDPKQLNVKKAKGDEEMMMEMMGIEEEDPLESSGDSIGSLSGGRASTGGGLDPLAFLENTATEASVSAGQISAILKRIKPATTFPGSRVAQELKVVSQLIAGDMPTSVYYLSLGGFDTHTNQAGSHANLMTQLGDALRAFDAELNAAGRDQRVVTLVYSEFGRRVKENGSGGTDHGAAAPVFVMGAPVQGGLHGQRPGMAPDQLNRGDIVHHVDYRSIYATLLAKHMGVDPTPILRKSFKPIGII